MNFDHAAEVIQTLTRPVVTIIFAATLSWGFIAGKVAGEAYLPIAALIMGFWFQQRAQEKDNVANKAADKLVAKMTEPAPPPAAPFGGIVIDR